MRPIDERKADVVLVFPTSRRRAVAQTAATYQQRGLWAVWGENLYVWNNIGKEYVRHLVHDGRSTATSLRIHVLPSLRLRRKRLHGSIVKPLRTRREDILVVRPLHLCRRDINERRQVLCRQRDRRVRIVYSINGAVLDVETCPDEAGGYNENLDGLRLCRIQLTAVPAAAARQEGKYASMCSRIVSTTAPASFTPKT